MTSAVEQSGSPRRRCKSDAAFRTISEVSTALDLPQHVLRFWETRFSQIQPLKRGGGRRYYRPEDVTLLRRIRHLLYDEGYTIRGVQKLLRQNGGRMPAGGDGDVNSTADGTGADAGLAARQRHELERLLADLESLRESLRQERG